MIFGSVLEALRRLLKSKAMEKKVLLVHTFETHKETIGQMVVIEDAKAIFTCDTLELPWIDNIRRKSRIYEGTFECAKVEATPKIPYEHIWVKNVLDRSGICIHIGNYATGKKVDILGCILVGSSHADINGDGQLDITNSRNTFNKLMAILPDSFNLIIK